MTKLFVTTALLLSTLGTVIAQEVKEENIIIRKRGSEKGEKMVIVVEGDKITVNGKPVEEFKGANIEVRRTDGNARVITMPRPPRAPGGWAQKRSMNITMRNDKPRLGIVTEKAANGVLIKDVVDSSAAQKAGLKEGDILLSINDTAVATGDDIITILNKHKEGDEVSVKYTRDGKEKKVKVKLQKSKQVNAFSFTTPEGVFEMPDVLMGLQPGDIETIDMFGPEGPRRPAAPFYFNRKPKLGVEIEDTPDNSGVKLLSVDAEGAAAKAGLQKGDLVNNVNGKKVSSVDDLMEALEDVEPGEAVTFSIVRNGTPQTITMNYPKRIKKANL